MKQLRMWPLVGSIAVAVGLCGAASAQGTQVSVKQAVRAQERAIRPQLNKLLRAANSQNSQPAKVERVTGVLQQKVRHAGQVVAAAQASNSQIAAAQRTWVSAAHELAHGLGQLIAALRAAQNNQAAVAKRDARNATRTINAADARESKADGQLGIT